MAARSDIWSDPLVVETEDGFVVEQVDPPYTRLEQPDPIDELFVAIDELVAGLPVAEHECVADEHLAGETSIDTIETDRAAADDRQAEQRDRLGDDGPAGPIVPPRIAVGTFDQMLCQRFDPFGLDCDDPTRPQPIGFDQFGRHHPTRGTLRQHRSGSDHESGIARPAKLAPIAVAHTEVRQQTSQHRAMHEIGVALVERRSDLQLAGDLSELAVQVAPLAHPQIVEVFVSAHTTELVARQFTLTLSQIVPERHGREQVGALDIEATVQLGRLLGGLLGTFADVLDR